MDGQNRLCWIEPLFWPPANSHSFLLLARRLKHKAHRTIGGIAICRLQPVPANTGSDGWGVNVNWDAARAAGILVVMVVLSRQRQALHHDRAQKKKKDSREERKFHQRHWLRILSITSKG